MHSDHSTVVAATFIGMLVGIAGTIGSLTGTAALRHSLYSAGAALAVGVAMIIFFALVRPSPMGTKTFVALLSGMVLAVAWLVVRSRRRRQTAPSVFLEEEAVDRAGSRYALDGGSDREAMARCRADQQDVA